MRILLAVLSAWFPLTSLPSIGTVSWRCVGTGFQLAFRLDKISATTDVRYRAPSGRTIQRTLNAGRVALPPFTSGTARLRLLQGTEARTLDARVAVTFVRGESYCWSYLVPPFTVRLTRR